MCHVIELLEEGGLIYVCSFPSTPQSHLRRKKKERGGRGRLWRFARERKERRREREAKERY